MLGCPIGCLMCDAGGFYRGPLTAKEITQQVYCAAARSWPGGEVCTKKFKIQFARMGEPVMNPAVLDAMEELAFTYPGDSLNVSLSTVAPATSASSAFLEKLRTVKNRHFAGGRFQLQFSIHTTDEKKRDKLIPVRKWGLGQIAEFGKKFCDSDAGDRKITLNFALVDGYSIDSAVLRKNFSPEHFLIKLTPLNPTARAHGAGLSTAVDPCSPAAAGPVVKALEKEGFEVLLSIGEPEENLIGSNCGQYIQRARTESHLCEEKR
jgi:23S rRNA (adenine2503-C2)-methyltransferase